MQYYYVGKSQDSLSRLGTSGAGLIRKTMDIEYDSQGYLLYPEPIQLGILGEEGETKLCFPTYEILTTYLITMLPELKSVLEQFSMPSHRWYKAQVGYNLDFVDRMKKYFNIEYNIDINEKRDYWILQILDGRREELAFSEMSFNVVDFRERKNILRTFDRKIDSVEEYNRLGKEVYLQSKKKQIIEDIDSLVYIYRNNYDILWGGTQIVFNQKVKQALEATGLITAENGLEFVEFTDYQIQMLEENT